MEEGNEAAAERQSVRTGRKGGLGWGAIFVHGARREKGKMPLRERKFARVVVVVLMVLVKWRGP